jgi:2-phosphoglycerate kinase
VMTVIGFMIIRQNIFWNKMKVESRGRFPWYDHQGQPIRPYIIGIGGGSASGKTSVSHRIIKQLGVPWVINST